MRCLAPALGTILKSLGNFRRCCREFVTKDALGDSERLTSSNDLRNGSKPIEISAYPCL